VERRAAYRGSRCVLDEVFAFEEREAAKKKIDSDGETSDPPEYG
jgi:hypothetical protein